MKVCLISEYFYPDNAGGTGTVLSSLVRQLKDTYQDLEIEVITSCNVYRGEQEKLASVENWDGVNIHRVNVPKAHPSSIKKRLITNFQFTFLVFKKMLRRGGYDLVLVSTAPPSMPMAAKAFKQLTGTPYVYIVYDLYPDIAVALDVLEPQSKPARVFRKLQKGWLHGASRTVVLGRCMADYLHKKYDLPTEKTRVIAVGADTKKVVPSPKNSNFRKVNGLNGFVVLWAGNFGFYQDFDSILDSAKVLQETHPDITFAFVGDGAKRSYIVDRIKTEGITNARLFPFVPEEDFSDMLASADVSLVALEPGSEGLGVPSKFYNILASGRPVVALVDPLSEVSRVIDESGCGVRSERDGNLLAETLVNLRDNPDKVEAMGHNAREVCEKKYSIDHVCHHFYNVIQSVPLGLRASRPILRMHYGLQRKSDKPESLI
ncbi:glycosyltransferase WbuB [bacterium]|nr:MAG: glycosyltransferase WbuB [bacterium]